MSVFKLLVCFLTAAMIAGAADPVSLHLWPGDAPGDKASAGVEHDATTSRDGLVGGKSVIRLANVSTPTITLYRPAKGKETGAAVVVFPGGGYTILAMDLEGTEICEWLNSIGVTAVLLKYRVPARPGRLKYEAPLQDAQRAFGMVRFHAAEWGIDPKRIGVIGFSAGGHLAAALSNNFANRSYDPVDEADKASCRPDFALLVYPAYLTASEQYEKIAPELNITSSTPPTFLVQTQDDSVHVENSLIYYTALKNAKVAVEMHLFATGRHGYGLRPSQHAVTTWPRLAEQWFHSQAILSK